MNLGRLPTKKALTCVAIATQATPATTLKDLVTAAHNHPAFPHQGEREAIQEDAFLVAKNHLTGWETTLGLAGIL